MSNVIVNRCGHPPRRWIFSTGRPALRQCPEREEKSSVPDLVDMSKEPASVLDMYGAKPGLEKGFPVFNVKTLELRIEDSMARERLVGELSAAFGILALVLAAIGLYGVLAYSVSRRTREIGIRMALGSSGGSVLWLVAKEGLALVGAGSLAGVAIAVLAGKFLASYWFGLTVGDPVIVIGASALMMETAAAAVSIAAARACRVDPLVALRYE
jgi:hypothetical protein